MDMGNITRVHTRELRSVIRWNPILHLEVIMVWGIYLGIDNSYETILQGRNERGYILRISVHFSNGSGKVLLHF